MTDTVMHARFWLADTTAPGPPAGAFDREVMADPSPAPRGQADPLAGLAELLGRHAQVAVQPYLQPPPAAGPNLMLFLAGPDPGAVAALARALAATPLVQAVQGRWYSGYTPAPRYPGAWQAAGLVPDQAAPGLTATAAPPDPAAPPEWAVLLQIARYRDWHRLTPGARDELMAEHLAAGLPYLERIQRQLFVVSERVGDGEEQFLYLLEGPSPQALQEIRDRFASLRAAQFWAGHHQLFQGAPAGWAQVARTLPRVPHPAHLDPYQLPHPGADLPVVRPT